MGACSSVSLAASAASRSRSTARPATSRSRVALLSAASSVCSSLYERGDSPPLGKASAAAPRGGDFAVEALDAEAEEPRLLLEEGAARVELALDQLLVRLQRFRCDNGNAVEACNGTRQPGKGWGCACSLRRLVASALVAPAPAASSRDDESSRDGGEAAAGAAPVVRRRPRREARGGRLQAGGKLKSKISTFKTGKNNFGYTSKREDLVTQATI